MAVSIFDLFKVGIGPSSSHTMGPMRAARRFVMCLSEQAILQQVEKIEVVFYGSLAHTGRGHGSGKAVMLGLEGETPELVDIELIPQRIKDISKTSRLLLASHHKIVFAPATHLKFNKKEILPYHPNGMCFSAFDKAKKLLDSRIYYSVGGGFVVNADAAANNRIVPDSSDLPYGYRSADELLSLCEKQNLTIAQIVFENEKTWLPAHEIKEKIAHIWVTMKACIKRGYETEGFLPGGLKVKRRAPLLYNDLLAKSNDPLKLLDWINLFALAVNEENASGGRVVTAPTNGAAGVLPALAMYYERFCSGATTEGIETFFLTAGAIGILYKENASISGAEVGCQGEVGVACSMGAGGLAAALGGTAEQIENAAEIGMEHNLGLTCDPVGGLVQIPCIERNAMGAVKALNAVRIALRGDGKHKVSLDKVIKTMRQTGADMKTKYKETSRGGLAVNVIEC